MSQIFDTQTTSNEPLNRFAIPIRYGLMVGFISMFLSTITFLYILKVSFIAFGAAGFLMFAVPVVFYGIAAAQQRKAFGGFITLKDAFQAVFIVILISLTISSIYGLVYAKYIDPTCMERVKEAMLNFFESMKSMPQASIDEQIAKIDAQVSSSTQPARLLYSFAQSIIIHSIFGFIAALIVSRKKPLITQ